MNYAIYKNLNLQNIYPLYFVAGQSNAAGFGDKSQLATENLYLNSTQNNSLIWNGTTFVALNPGVTNLLGSSSNKFGPEVSCSYNFTAKYGKSYVVKYALGNTSLGNTSGEGWLPSLNSYYTNLKNYILGAINYLNTANIKYRIVGLIWHQGENDASTDLFNSYAEHFTQLKNALRYDIDPNLKLIIGGIPSNGINMSLIPIQRNNAEMDFNARFIDLQGLTNDPAYGIYHLDANAQVIAGNRYFNVMK